MVVVVVWFIHVGCVVGMFVELVGGVADTPSAQNHVEDEQHVHTRNRTTHASVRIVSRSCRVMASLGLVDDGNGDPDPGGQRNAKCGREAWRAQVGRKGAGGKISRPAESRPVQRADPVQPHLGRRPHVRLLPRGRGPSSLLKNLGRTEELWVGSGAPSVVWTSLGLVRPAPQPQHDAETPTRLRTLPRTTQSLTSSTPPRFPRSSKQGGGCPRPTTRAASRT